MKKQFTILYVENDSAVQSELLAYLKEFFQNILITNDGLDALELYKNNHIDLILTDLELPSISGLEFIKKIKKLNSQLPILVITAHNESEYLIECIKQKVDGFILKPICLNELEIELLDKIKLLEDRKLSRLNEVLLNEYKDAVDESSIFSKTDLNGFITYANDKFCEISGYSREELVGSNHNIVRHPDMPAEIFFDLWHTIENKKETWYGKIKNRKKDGGHYWVDATIKPILNCDGDIIEFVGLRYDITELENYKTLIKNQLDDTSRTLDDHIHYIEQYEKAINQSLAVIKTDLDNNIIFVNKKFCELSGYSCEELHGTNLYDYVDDEYTDIIDIDKIVYSLRQKTPVCKKVVNIAKDGSKFFMDTIIHPIINKEDELLEKLHLLSDITEVTNMHKEIEDTQKEIVYKMGQIGENRSREIGNHVKRVAHYSKLLAELIGLPKVDILYAASPMHDIGKVAIEDKILHKPDKLTPEEFDIIKSHAQIGYEILTGSKMDVFEAAAIVAHTHHEKWDGSGYPLGLKGDQIHIFGRITSIVDVYDALGYDRVYKEAWPLEKVYQYIEDAKGTHFDPNLAVIFLRNKEKFEQIRGQF